MAPRFRCPSQPRHQHPALRYQGATRSALDSTALWPYREAPGVEEAPSTGAHLADALIAFGLNLPILGGEFLKLFESPSPLQIW